MKKQNSSLNERGIAHLGLIIIIVVVLGLGVFAYMRVSESNQSEETTTSSQTTNEDQSNEDESSEAEASQAAQEADLSSDEAAAVQESENVVE